MDIEKVDATNPAKVNLKFEGRELTVYFINIPTYTNSKPCHYCGKPGDDEVRIKVTEIITDDGTSIVPEDEFFQRTSAMLQKELFEGRVRCGDESCFEKSLDEFAEKCFSMARS